MRAEIKRKLVIFLLLTFGLSAIFLVPIATAGTVQAGGGLFTAGLMWAPGVAALITLLITQGNLRGIGWRWGKTRYQILSVGLPFLMFLVTYGVVWLTGLGGFPNQEFLDMLALRQGLEGTPLQVILIQLLRVSTLGLLTSAVTALGEEIGWRGLLLPQLAKTTSFTKAALLTGAVWSLWHFPGMIFADYGAAVPTWYAMICFTVILVSGSVIYAWLRLKSGSVWTAVLFHASHNVFIQAFFTPLTADTGLTEYVIDDFGVGLAIAFSLAAFIFWRMRDRLGGVNG